MAGAPIGPSPATAPRLSLGHAELACHTVPQQDDSR